MKKMQAAKGAKAAKTVKTAKGAKAAKTVKTAKEAMAAIAAAALLSAAACGGQAADEEEFRRIVQENGYTISDGGGQAGTEAQAEADTEAQAEAETTLYAVKGGSFFEYAVFSGSEDACSFFRRYSIIMEEEYDSSPAGTIQRGENRLIVSCGEKYEAVLLKGCRVLYAQSNTEARHETENLLKKLGFF